MITQHSYKQYMQNDKLGNIPNKTKAVNVKTASDNREDTNIWLCKNV